MNSSDETVLKKRFWVTTELPKLYSIDIKAVILLGFEVYRYSKISQQLSEIFGKNQKTVIGNQ